MDRDFFKIPHEIVDSGLLAKLKPSEIKVYLVIARFADYKTGRAFPSIELICKLSGVNRNVVCRAIKRLVYFGLIEKYRAPKTFSYRNVYRAIRNPQINPNNIPQKVKRKCTKPRGKDGKFQAVSKKGNADTIPQNMENIIPQKVELDTIPQKVDPHIFPRNMENKEKERELKRDTRNLHELNKEEEEWIKGKWEPKYE